MKERPILFSGPMVRAILNGRKTVTRREVKHQPDVPVTDAIPRRNYPHGPATVDWYWRPKHGHLNGVPSHGWDFTCPYGEPGDRLWVREAFNRTNPGGAEGVFYYRADGQFPAAIGGGRFHGTEAWKPSIHMPRAASRILLEITAVRVERLQGISNDQATAEGMEYCADDLDPEGIGYSSAELFSILWASTYGHESWHANPWVWVVEFRRVEL